MPRITVTDLPWKDLFKRVDRGECTPFIGAGASAGTLPLAAGLARELVAEDERDTRNRCPLPDHADLARVCQYLAVTHKDANFPKDRIAERITNLGRPDFGKVGEPHATLAQLPLPVYLTTNYDDFMITALRRRVAGARREVARWRKSLLNEEDSAFDAGYTPTPQDPVVFHLHGHTGIPRTMVATEDDYVDFLVNISKDLANSPTGPGMRAILPLRIRRAITNHMLLFVGYGLADINFRVVLRGLVGSLERSERVVSMAIQYSEGTAQDLEEYLEEYFQWSLDLQIFWGSATDFATELSTQWTAHAAAAR